MNDTLKKNMTWFVCGGLGILNYILFAIPYISSYKEIGDNESFSNGVSGYKIMDMFNTDHTGVMCSFLQILVLIVSIGLLAIGVFGLLKEFGIYDITSVVKQIELKKFAQYGLYAYAGLNILLLIFLIIFCISNSRSDSIFGIEISSSGFSLSAGIFITLILSVGAVVGLRFFEQKFPAGENTGMIVTYNCSKCGKKVKSTVKFCPDCGGEVIKVEKEANPKFACSSCGAPAKAGVKFCSQCGGAIVQLERVVEPTYVCSSCGAASEANVKFCSKCGGAIIQK